jgi:polyhydroxyalkanoate synthesis regulator phasin
LKFEISELVIDSAMTREGIRNILEGEMAKKSRLTNAAEKIGAAMGRADRKAHQVAKAGVMAKKELAAISGQVDALKKQLEKTAKKLKKALA